MEIKFGTFVVKDWKRVFGSPIISCKPMILSNGDRVSGAVIMNGMKKRFSVYFQYDMAFLQNIWGYPEFDNDEVWIQNHVDEFLIRMSKLRAFI
jgi:hypothetical protein